MEESHEKASQAVAAPLHRVAHNGTGPDDTLHTPDERNFVNRGLLQWLKQRVDIRYQDELRNFGLFYEEATLQKLRQIREESAHVFETELAAWARQRPQREAGLNWEDLLAHILSARPAHLPTPLPDAEEHAPALPPEAVLDPALARGAAPLLEAYIADSLQWSTRAPYAFHEAVGVWLLSTLAARRICVQMGDTIYPNLYLALVAESSLYYKSTTARHAKRALTQCGCDFLLTPDRLTPQKLLHMMHARVPEGYESLDDEEQTAVRTKLPFVAKRGWFYDEWGGLLEQLVRRDSALSQFHEYLRVLYDNEDTFRVATIQRGEETIREPYLALLTSATPQDLAPVMRPSGPLWRDGFWARFAFVTPLPSDVPSLASRPHGHARLPEALQSAFVKWHIRLETPQAHIAATRDAKGQPLGGYTLQVPPVPCHAMDYADTVKAAYDRYSMALSTLMQQADFPRDFRPCYVRHPDKTLRVAMLLASLHDSPRLELSHWTYAQAITERWRDMLHQLCNTVEHSQPRSNEQLLEERIVNLLTRHGPQSARQLQRRIYRGSSREINLALKNLREAQVIDAYTQGKGTIFHLLGDE